MPIQNNKYKQNTASKSQLISNSKPFRIYNNLRQDGNRTRKHGNHMPRHIKTRHTKLPKSRPNLKNRVLLGGVNLYCNEYDTGMPYNLKIRNQIAKFLNEKIF